MEGKKEKLETFLEKQYDRVNIWIAFVEAKNAALIALNMAIIAVFWEQYSMAPICCSLLVLSLIISSGCCLWSFLPKDTSDLSQVPVKKKTANKKNLFYWGDIASFEGEEQYINKICEMYYPDIDIDNMDNKIKDMAQEIVINSRITQRKSDLFKIAVNIDLLSFLFIVLLIIIA